VPRRAWTAGFFADFDDEPVGASVWVLEGRRLGASGSRRVFTPPSLTLSPAIVGCAISTSSNCCCVRRLSARPITSDPRTASTPDQPNNKRATTPPAGASPTPSSVLPVSSARPIGTGRRTQTSPSMDPPLGAPSCTPVQLQGLPVVLRTDAQGKHAEKRLIPPHLVGKQHNSTTSRANGRTERNLKRKRLNARVLNTRYLHEGHKPSSACPLFALERGRLLGLQDRLVAHHC
jgi:hypothetical protein